MDINKKMKGITCCGDCGYYSWRKHGCTRAVNEGSAQDHFYADCPLPDVILAQEPRVMTLSEVWDASMKPQERALFVEYFDPQDKEEPYSIILSLVHNETLYRQIDPLIVAVSWAGGREFFSPKDYGKEKRWRCWTSRPTDEQREAEPWA